jgi:hypothetical protein
MCVACARAHARMHAAGSKAPAGPGADVIYTKFSMFILFLHVYVVESVM